mgnify:CR=1 FL=1
MIELCKRRNTCRLCNKANLKLAFSLEPTPPANAFVDKQKISINQDCYPLDVFFCKDCKHVQLLDVVDSKILFEDYVYVSGTSPVFVKHFEEYANFLIENYLQNKKSLVIDIGSNDGTLLSFFKEKGVKVLGVDPAKEISSKANSNGIETLNNFFTFEFSKLIQKKYGRAEIITANNVFAHVNDMKDLINGIKNLLAPNGIFVFEVSYLVDVIQKNLFDMIYHEHLSYHSVIPLIKFFKDNEMELIEVIRVDSHGGSLRGVVQMKGGSHKISDSINHCITREKEIEIDQFETYVKFSHKINKEKNELQKLLQKLKNDKKSIAGFGAPAKATTFLYHFAIKPGVIDYIIDDSPLKQGLFTPGMHIPVYSSEKLYEKTPDYVIILAWNFAESIMKRHKKIKDFGGHFIVPLPQLKVY